MTDKHPPPDGVEHRCEDKRCGRRGECPLLDDDALEDIAEKAADRAIAKMTATVYQEVGRSVIGKMIYLAGALVIGSYLWARGKGYVQ
jgi:hypothetical protein